MKWTTFFAIVISLSLLIYLSNQAAQGNIAAWVIIAALVTVLLIMVGAMIHHAGVKSSTQREQANFAANARENMDLMKMMIAAQNAQLTGALRSQRLNQPAVSNGGYPALPPLTDSNGAGFPAFTIAGLDEPADINSTYGDQQ